MLSLRKTYAGRIKHPDDATEPATLDPLSSIAPLFRARHGHEAVALNEHIQSCHRERFALISCVEEVSGCGAGSPVWRRA
jgi:hypothetical protein